MALYRVWYRRGEKKRVRSRVVTIGSGPSKKVFGRLIRVADDHIGHWEKIG